MYLIEWMDYSCTDALPSYLGLLHIIIHKVVLFVSFYCYFVISKKIKDLLFMYYALFTLLLHFLKKLKPSLA